MAQKVQVLASIAHEPELVILDEPFSGLDPVNQAVLEEVIQELKAKGVTVVFSTHVMQHAERLCDRLLILSLLFFPHWAAVRRKTKDPAIARQSRGLWKNISGCFSL